MEIEEGLLVFSFSFPPCHDIFQVGNNQSTSWQIPLRCILDNWKLFNPLILRKSHWKFFCATAWPQYPQGDEEHWPEDESLNYNTILQLELFCKIQGKWTEIPYVQIFFWLRDTHGSVCKKSVCNAGDPGSIPGSGRSPGEGIGYPLQYTWASLVAQLVKNPPECRRPVFDPWVEKIPWRRKRLPTPVFWPGKLDGLYSSWGHKELDTTEPLSQEIWRNSFLGMGLLYALKVSLLSKWC